MKVCIFDGRLWLGSLILLAFCSAGCGDMQSTKPDSPAPNDSSARNSVVHIELEGDTGGGGGPEAISAVSDLRLCMEQGDCEPLTPDYTDQGGGFFAGYDHRLYQLREEIPEGEAVGTDVLATYQAYFRGQPNPEPGFLWVGSSCEQKDDDKYYDCFNLYLEHQSFTPQTAQQVVLNSRYCVSFDIAFPYCQGGLPQTDPDGEIIRATPSEEAICYLSSDPELFWVCHDMLFEVKTLP